MACREAAGSFEIVEVKLDAISKGIGNGVDKDGLSLIDLPEHCPRLVITIRM